MSCCESFYLISADISIRILNVNGIRWLQVLHNTDSKIIYDESLSQHPTSFLLGRITDEVLSIFAISQATFYCWEAVLFNSVDTFSLVNSIECDILGPPSFLSFANRSSSDNIEAVDSIISIEGSNVVIRSLNLTKIAIVDLRLSCLLNSGCLLSSSLLGYCSISGDINV